MPGTNTQPVYTKDLVEAQNRKDIMSSDWYNDMLKREMNNPTSPYYKGTNLPQSPQQVQPFLDQVQAQTYGQYNTTNIVDSDLAQRTNQIESEIAPEVTPPQAPNLVQTYNNLRDTYNLGSLERRLNELSAQENEIYSRLNQRRTTERGKQVSMNVISGRIGEVERQERENLDLILRNKEIVANQVQTAYGIIDTITKLTDMDFNNASKTYNDRFNQKMQMYEMAWNQKKDERDFQFRKDEADKQAARANLEVYADLISEGQMAWKELDQTTRLAIEKLEISSGLGKGFISKLRMKPGANIVHTSTRVAPDGTQYVDTLIANPDGTYTTKSIKQGKVYIKPTSSSGLSRTDVKRIFDEMDKKYDNLMSDNEPMVVDSNSGIGKLHSRQTNLSGTGLTYMGSTDDNNKKEKEDKKWWQFWK